MKGVSEEYYTVLPIYVGIEGRIITHKLHGEEHGRKMVVV